MKTNTLFLLIAIALVSVTSCVPEEVTDLKKICMISSANPVIALSIKSSEPLPENLKVAFNDSEYLYADECGESMNSGITFDQDRKRAVVTFNLARGSEEYEAYISGDGQPIQEYFNAQVFSRETCKDSHDLDQEKLNVLINWESLSESCGRDSYQAFSQFTFQP